MPTVLADPLDLLPAALAGDEDAARTYARAWRVLVRELLRGAPRSAPVGSRRPRSGRGDRAVRPGRSAPGPRVGGRGHHRSHAASARHRSHRSPFGARLPALRPNRPERAGRTGDGARAPPGRLAAQHHGRGGAVRRAAPSRPAVARRRRAGAPASPSCSPSNGSQNCSSGTWCPTGSRRSFGRRPPPTAGGPCSS